MISPFGIPYIPSIFGNIAIHFWKVIFYSIGYHTCIPGIGSGLYHFISHGAHLTGHIPKTTGGETMVSNHLPSGELSHSNGKIHHVEWENPLFLWPFSIAMLVHQRVLSYHFVSIWIRAVRGAQCCLTSGFMVRWVVYTPLIPGDDTYMIPTSLAFYRIYSTQCIPHK